MAAALASAHVKHLLHNTSSNTPQSAEFPAASPFFLRERTWAGVHIVNTWSPVLHSPGYKCSHCERSTDSAGWLDTRAQPPDCPAHAQIPPLHPLLYNFMSNHYVELKQARSELAKKRRSSSAKRHVSRPGSFARPTPLPWSRYTPALRATRPAVASLSRLQGITWSGAFRRNSPAKASTPQLN